MAITVQLSSASDTFSDAKSKTYFLPVTHGSLGIAPETAFFSSDTSP